MTCSNGASAYFYRRENPWTGRSKDTQRSVSRGLQKIRAFALPFAIRFRYGTRITDRT